MWGSDFELLATLGQKHWDKVFNRPCFSRRVEEGGEETPTRRGTLMADVCLFGCVHMELGCLMTDVAELLGRDLFQKGVSRWSESDLLLGAFVFLQRAAQFDDR